MGESTVRYVRLKPHNPKAGQLVQRYHYKKHLYITDPETQRPVWYKIDDEKLLKDLRSLRQQDRNVNSPKVFDIYDEKEYIEILGEEERFRMAQLGIASAAATVSRMKPPTVERTGPGGRAVAVPTEGEAAKVEAVDDAPAPPEDEAAPEGGDGEGADASDGDGDGESPKPGAAKKRRRGGRG